MLRVSLRRVVLLAAAAGLSSVLVIGLARSALAVAAMKPIDARRLLGAPVTADLKVISHPGVTPSLVAPTAASVATPAHALLFSKIAQHAVTDRTPDFSGSATGLSLPYRWLSTSPDLENRAIKPVIAIEGGGLVFDVIRRTFIGQLRIELVNVNNPAEGRVELPSPIMLQLSLTKPGSLSPSIVKLSHTRLEPEIVNVATQAGADLHVETMTDPAGVTVPLASFSPRVELSAVPTSLQAFGLGSSVVTIALPADGSSNDSVTVVLSAKQFDVNPSEVVVYAKRAPPQVTIHSGPPGKHKLHATIAGMAAGDIDLHFLWPWLFLSAWATGALVGAGIVWGAAVGNRTPARFFAAVARGAFVALLMAVLGAVGIDVLNLKLSDPSLWAATFVVAALASWLGESALAKFRSAAGESTP